MTDDTTGAPGGPESEEAGRAGRAPEEAEGSRSGSPHTSPKEGHPAGPGERTDRDVGGPTSPDEPAGEEAAGGAEANATREKDTDDWVTGDEPMTGPQASYLETLCQEAGEEFDGSLTKAQASKRIDELQAKTGRGR